jgi:hypothetical protein
VRPPSSIIGRTAWPPRRVAPVTSTLGIANKPDRAVPASTLYDFFSQDFSRADLIALGALGVAALSAVYARRQSIEATKARISSQREARRPQRLQVLSAMQDFARFCTQYYTRYLQGQTNGTRGLVDEIEHFRTSMEKSAIYDMPAVVAKAKLLESTAWRLQRSLDRLGAPTIEMATRATEKPDDAEIHEVIDVFASQATQLRDIFAPYLHEDGDA